MSTPPVVVFTYVVALIVAQAGALGVVAALVLAAAGALAHLLAIEALTAAPDEDDEDEPASGRSDAPLRDGGGP